MVRRIPKLFPKVSKIDQFALGLWVHYCVTVPLDVCSRANSTDVHLNEQLAGFQVTYSCCLCLAGRGMESRFTHHGAAYFLQSSVRSPSLKRGLLDG
jgi:hypothetical protein